MKIALVSPYDFAYPGGVANHISNLDRHLREMGHQVRVIAPASRTISAFGDRFIPMGRPRPIPSSGAISRVTLSLALADRIKGVLRDERFDIVHLHEPFMPMLCSAVLRFSDSVNVGTFHAFDGRPGYYLAWPIGMIMLKRRCQKLDGRIAVSDPAWRFASQHIPGDFKIIPNGVDLNNFSPNVSPIPEFMDGKLNILFVSRLERRKGLDYLLRAYHQIKDQVPDSRLIVVGPGTSLRWRYERWVKNKGLRDVVFVGYVSEEDKPRYFKTADVFCVPATGRESFGVILVEAMAMGKPIVATNIPGYASVVTNGKEGILVSPKNVPQLAQALLSVLRDERLRKEMGARGSIKAQQYAWDRVSRQIFDYYLKVMNGRATCLE
ncbi:MAG: glycosyltransferase family 4 protein [Chloroflexi bacterium]|nr:glycosyltransferase family 4 protein [Chloroflexota bacterium]